MREQPPVSLGDQAAGLRRLFAARRPPARIVPLLTLGDDHRGLAVDLAAALTRQGERVLLLDGESGQIAPMLGLKARYDLRHVLSGERALEMVALAVDDGFRVMPAGRLLRAAARGRVAGPDLHRWLATLGGAFDVVVAYVDPETVLPLLADVAEEVVLICGADPLQVARAYGRIKLLIEGNPDRRFQVAYCQAGSIDQALAAHARLGRATQRHLGAEVGFAGVVVAEPALRRARERGSSLFEIDGDCDAARALEAMALALRPAASDSRFPTPPSVASSLIGHVHPPRHPRG